MVVDTKYVFSRFESSLPWIKDHTIFLTKHGSHAYGTNTPKSDIDIRGVCIPPREYFFGFHKRFEQAESKEVDCTIYDIRKFFHLASDCNPNILEFLWIDPSDWILPEPRHRDRENLWMRILRHREEFLSKKIVYTYRGYAISQLKRIQTHRRWLLNPVEHKPTREEFGLPERTLIPADHLAAAQSAIQKKMDSWALDLDEVPPDKRVQILESVTNTLTEILSGNLEEGKERSAAHLIGYDDNMIEILMRERRYKSAQQEYTNYQNWKKNRNPARAELETKYGFDAKHSMHLIRLMRQCREILEGKGVIVRRPDAEELLAIRNGAWSYEQTLEWAENQDRELLELSKTSKLPHSSNSEELDSLCQRVVEEALVMGIV